MNAHAAFIQTIQVAILLCIFPILMYHVVRIFVKVKVFLGMYGTDFRRYIDDKILQETGNQNKKKEI